ncbi:hypothetical protein RRG08_029332 [Elysia crispata]|uniref:Uncharacterized protein n=1 Tax=Elysia crispata TaxID=231223 RepID=A0AAE1AS53_9GAST|nr:hypothetical protein RRG08_029332 [Elysia crispata]
MCHLSACGSRDTWLSLVPDLALSVAQVCRVHTEICVTYQLAALETPGSAWSLIWPCRWRKVIYLSASVQSAHRDMCHLSACGSRDTWLSLVPDLALSVAQVCRVHTEICVTYQLAALETPGSAWSLIWPCRWCTVIYLSASVQSAHRDMCHLSACGSRDTWLSLVPDLALSVAQVCRVHTEICVTYQLAALETPGSAWSLIWPCRWRKVIYLSASVQSAHRDMCHLSACGSRDTWLNLVPDLALSVVHGDLSVCQCAECTPRYVSLISLRV